MGRVHIIGAGLAGLSAAVRLSDAGIPLCLYEAAPRAGGRCRSFHDAKLDCIIDNGNHLMMSANHAALAYLAEIGASDSLAGPEEADYPFFDLESKERWTVRLDRGRFQGWIFDPSRRVPGTKARDYLSALTLLLSGKNARTGDVLDQTSQLYRRFWEPLILAALNTQPDKAAAALLKPVLLETFARGAAFAKPLIVRDSLAASLIDPAVARLEAQGVAIRYGCRIDRLVFEGARAAALVSNGATFAMASDDQLLLAVPSFIARDLVPGLQTPEEGEAIVNVHFRMGGRISETVAIIGVIGGMSQWLFLHGDLVSVTISAADKVAALPADAIAERVWREVALVLDMPDNKMPPVRVIKEKRATFSATPESLARRPGARTAYANMALAGDWTATGLPSTIESAIRSGHKAAALLMDDRRKMGAANAEITAR